MTVDDAGTLARGGMKIDAAWRQDDQARGPDLVFGHSPIEGLELGLAAGLAHDHAQTPSTRTRALGVSAKWVPWTNETGWSAGLSLSFGHARVHDRATPHRHTEDNWALVALLSHVWETGHKLHVNLGRERLRAPEARGHAAVWGTGMEWALLPVLQLTIEAFGSDTGRPDRAVGLRYKAIEGVKLSAAVGQGNDRHFGQIGFAWEL